MARDGKAGATAIAASDANPTTAGRAGNLLAHAITSAIAAIAPRIAVTSVVVTVSAAPGIDAAAHAIQSNTKSSG